MSVRVSRFLADQRIIRHPRNPGHPRVSVVMPTYKLRPDGTNRRAIESVLGQSFGDFEFLIIDDGSIDGLHAMLRDYQQQDPRIVLVRHETNSGLPALRLDEGLLLAKGRYVAYQFVGDEWNPDCLARLVETAEKESGGCLAYGPVEVTFRKGDGLIERRMLGDRDFSYSDLRSRNLMAHCAVLHPRSVLDACGLYDPHILLRRRCDYDLWLRMAEILPVRHCPHLVGRANFDTLHSITGTVDQDLLLTHRYMAIDRTARLRPGAILDYEVDALPESWAPGDAYRARAHYIIPFWAQRPAVLAPAERKVLLAARADPRRVLATAASHQSSIDVTLTNFGRVLGPAAQSVTWVPEEHVGATLRWNCETLVLCKAVGEVPLAALSRARAQGKTVVYTMDDRLFKLGTGYLTWEFEYLRRGRPGYRMLEAAVAGVDLVIGYAPTILADCRIRTPRVIELKTNIPEVYIRDAAPLDGGKESGRRLKYAVLTGSARRQECRVLWAEISKFSRRCRAAIEVHFWGLDPAEFDEPLACPTFYRPYNHNYYAYLQGLTEERFDFVVCPLFDDHEAKRAKSPIKYLEATAAGAVGIFSDVPPYRAVTDGVTGLKVVNIPGAWLRALEASLDLGDEARRRIHAAAKRHVLETFTTESQVLEYLAAFEAADLHAALGSHASRDGRAPVAFFFSEARASETTLSLLALARLTDRYRFGVILCFPSGQPLDPIVRARADRLGCRIETLEFRATADPARARGLAQWLREHSVRLVHTMATPADVLAACWAVGIPVVATLDGPPPPATDTSDATAASGGRRIAVVHSSSLRWAWRWQDDLGAPAFCIRPPVAPPYFDGFESHVARSVTSPPTLLMAAPLLPGEGQLQAIQAVAALAQEGIDLHLVLLGSDRLDSAYVAACREAVRHAGLSAGVRITGHGPDPQAIYEGADYVLCASDGGSGRESILHGMACGARVIAPPVRGSREVIVDGFSGVIADSTTVDGLASAIRRAIAIPERQWRRMTRHAHETARMVCSEEVVGFELLKLYNLACREHAGRGAVWQGGVRAPRLHGAIRVRGDAIRQRIVGDARRVGSWLERFTERRDFSGVLGPAFDSVKDDSLRGVTDPRGFRLQPGANLSRAVFVAYPLRSGRPQLSGLLLAPVVDGAVSGGVLGVEIVSPENTIVTQVMVPLSGVRPNGPTRLDFAPIHDSHRHGYAFRVFVRGASVPVRILEWRRYGRGGFGQRETRAFCGFVFPAPTSPERQGG